MLSEEQKEEGGNYIFLAYLLYKSNSYSHSSLSPTSAPPLTTRILLCFQHDLSLLQIHWKIFKLFRCDSILLELHTTAQNILAFYYAYPLSTPRTRFNIKKDPITISGIKKTQLKTVPRASLVQKNDMNIRKYIDVQSCCCNCSKLYIVYRGHDTSLQVI